MENDKEVWCVLELMGHVKLAGRLTEEEKFGAKMGRLDIPQQVPCAHCAGPEMAALHGSACTQCNSTGLVNGFVTQLFGGGSVYRITIVTEAVARQVCKQHSPAPVSPWDFPKQLTAPARAEHAYEDSFDDDDADEGNDEE